ncbi:MAG: hypothetical protein RMI83_02415 [Desulfurococcaceae archaeon]|nr:hypothetical protein [Sulfolobales archaeon]MDW8169940.1 hypothetical protein [Desulfurococcaceae archaeon]
MSAIAFIDSSKYPFLVDIDEFIEKKWPGLSLVELLLYNAAGILDKAIDNIKAIALGKTSLKHSEGTESEVISFYATMLLIALTGNKWLLDRACLHYAKRSAGSLIKEPPENIISIALALGVSISYSLSASPRIPINTRRGSVVYKELPYSLPVEQYLKYVGRIASDPKYCLVNQIISSGKAYIDKETLVRVLEERMFEYLREKFKPIEECPIQLRDVLEKVREALDKAGNVNVEYSLKSKEVHYINELYLGRISGKFIETAFPPCIMKILESLKKGENLSHGARFTLAAFLIKAGASIEEVLELFKHSPDFNEKIARYQIEHTAGLRGSRRSYMPYSCSKMKAAGLCPMEASCNVKNPIVAYKRNLSKIVGEKPRSPAKTSK